MANFIALESGSQGCGKPVLFLDRSASQASLFDAAEWRLGAVQDLLTALSTCVSDDAGTRDVANVSRALLLLVQDAEALLGAARQAS
ncbi:MAG TPA: hypothetical protein DCR78_13430 [Pseudomonas sp.]|jgi:hypothetical protein|uniref:hypothetical protein n=1 Tax=Stutzerimonas xanthomarina TaxID=271420 RepID=UPI000E97631C|nr:hypothetical protein [Stutzerimonas xanthomarina]MBU0810712.1 hypothetical protein [Gammaproteobacteria bacterium]HAQ87429.1 hypothetical protein [Pseudomonas sp.]MBK3847156.1 hypothetical protein [Stutzerimonas xanthomarina]MBU0853332.1 hypothetical protein [Gammaproteobacteria bacterium]MBU1300069.1 hypothetical protein [Gammaproteobacteria bacterium]|tara:strand:- start:10650 stop:10910 length:261 start_codon:yes stop_codon:yes gene_type:complete